MRSNWAWFPGPLVTPRNSWPANPGGLCGRAHPATKLKETDIAVLEFTRGGMAPVGGRVGGALGGSAAAPLRAGRACAFPAAAGEDSGMAAAGFLHHFLHRNVHRVDAREFSLSILRLSLALWNFWNGWRRRPFTSSAPQGAQAELSAISSEACGSHGCRWKCAVRRRIYGCGDR